MGNEIGWLGRGLVLAVVGSGLTLAGLGQTQTGQIQTGQTQTGQTQTGQTQTGQTGTAAAVPSAGTRQTSVGTRQTSAATRRARRRRVRTVPVETLAPAQPAASRQSNAATEAQQRAADAKLLQQQQAQSDKAAKINDEQVQRAQQRKDAVQNEIRIQDAPGPAQTGTVPSPVVVPQQTNPPQDQRIQDQPSAVPGQNTTPPQG